jgi:hypothetical protein
MCIQFPEYSVGLPSKILVRLIQTILKITHNKAPITTFRGFRIREGSIRQDITFPFVNEVNATILHKPVGR